jgi:hypothetical protein
MQKRGTQLPSRRKTKAIDVNERVERAFERGTPIDEAFEEAFREAVLQHKRAGQPLVFWKDGKSILVSAEEVEAELNARKAASKKPTAPRKKPRARKR